MIINLSSKYKSYDIMYMLLIRLRNKYGNPSKFVILDITYGKGRFYRKIRLQEDLFIVGVDITKHEWEVTPNIFYNMDSRYLTKMILDGKISIEKPHVIVVDPPWSTEKRGWGKLLSLVSYSKMPYHIKSVRSVDLIMCGIKLMKHFNVPLIYRYKEPLQGSSLIIKHHITVFRHKGVVYYGIIMP